MSQMTAHTSRRFFAGRPGLPGTSLIVSVLLASALVVGFDHWLPLLLAGALALTLLFALSLLRERRAIAEHTQESEDRLRAAESRARAAEALLLDAIDSLNEGFALLDRDDRLVLCNRRLRELFTFSADLLQPGATFETIIREGARRGQYVEAMGRIDQWVAERLAQHRDPGAAVVQQLGDGRWVLCRERRTQDGGTVSVWTDVSRLKNQELLLRDREFRLERMIEDLGESRGQLKELTAQMSRMAKDNAKHRSQAEAANAAKTQFLANVSHELRTPLNAILGFSEILKEQMYGPLGAREYADYAADIHESGTLLLNLINDLLDMAKIESGKFELQEEACDVADIVDTVTRVVAERAMRAQVGIEQRVAPLPPLLADDRKVRQILLNLLSNAIKFTPAGGTVCISAGPDAAGRIAITVSDTGIGIPPHQLERVLEPFTQVENIMTRKHAGTGLGLPLSKSLMDLHGGTLTLASELGSGTTVTIAFPASRNLLATATAA
jgi:two-component system cell cycle sensor histidine kinase PleC